MKNERKQNGHIENSVNPRLTHPNYSLTASRRLRVPPQHFQGTDKWHRDQEHHFHVYSSRGRRSGSDSDRSRRSSGRGRRSGGSVVPNTIVALGVLDDTREAHPIKKVTDGISDQVDVVLRNKTGHKA